MLSRHTSQFLRKGLNISSKVASARTLTIGFNYKDIFDIRSQLTEEECSLMDSTHDYCQSKLQPRVTEAFRHESKLLFYTVLFICRLKFVKMQRAI